LGKSGKIAKNTLLLYVRMLFSMLVSLYTSRIILNTLGIEDFGINNVVGGIVVMFSFLNSSMSGATSRFLTFELGRKDYQNLQKVFSVALTIHIIIALVILLLGETVGLWFLESKLIIPESRLWAARIVYQFSVFGMALGIIQVPYNALIIANERIDVFAYVEIGNILVRLLIVYLLIIIPFDKLVVLSSLGFAASLLVMAIYRFYCVRNLIGCRFILSVRNPYLRPMLLFSGWDLYGNMSVIARTQGVNILLNMFFGPLINAAAGIAGQVQGAVMGFAGNVLTATRPQVVKNYSVGDFARVEYLVNKCAVFTFMLLLLFTVPLLIETNYVLGLWLKIVPDYAVSFCRLTLLFNLFANLSSVVMIAIHATGKIKRPSLINGTLYLMVVPISYISFKLGGNPQWAYWVNVIAVFGGMLSNAWTLHLHLPSYSFKKFVINLMRCLSIAILVFGILYFCSSRMEEGLLRFIAISLSSALLIGAITYLVVMNKLERALVHNIIRRYCSR